MIHNSRTINFKYFISQVSSKYNNVGFLFICTKIHVHFVYCTVHTHIAAENVPMKIAPNSWKVYASNKHIVVGKGII